MSADTVLLFTKAKVTMTMLMANLPARDVAVGPTYEDAIDLIQVRVGWNTANGIALLQAQFKLDDPQVKALMIWTGIRKVLLSGDKKNDYLISRGQNATDAVLVESIEVTSQGVAQWEAMEADSKVSSERIAHSMAKIVAACLENADQTPDDDGIDEDVDTGGEE